jgi:glycosyltransferase involved in cell wall biosynthesis
VHKPRVLVVLNHSIFERDGGCFIEAAEAALVRAVEEGMPAEVMVAAFVQTRGNSSLSGAIDKPERIIDLGRLPQSAGATFRKVWQYLSAAIRLPFCVWRADAIYIFCPGHIPLLAAFWARLLGRKYGFYVRGTWLTRGGGTPWYWRIGFRGSEFMIVTGEAFRRRLSSYCAVVENEVPLTAIRPGRPMVPVGSVTGRPIRLLFAGRLTAEKGLHDVVKAVGLLKADGIPATLVVAGGGTEEEVSELRAVMSEAGVTEDVTVAGQLDTGQLERAYQEADVFVFPSYFAEGFPRVLYEAMMFGRAIVTTEMPGLQGFLVHGRNCLYVEAKRPDDVADKVASLVRDPELMERISSEAKREVERVFASFRHASHGEQLIELMRGALAKQGGQA